MDKFQYLINRLTHEDDSIGSDRLETVCAEFKGAARDALLAGISLSTLSECIEEVGNEIENGYI